MQTFSLLIIVLCVFVLLWSKTSLWMAFGIIYMAGMLLLAAMALVHKNRRQENWRRVPCEEDAS